MKISVIIAVYNGQDFIEKALESCHHFDCVKEVVLVDDGSTDKSHEIALSCKEKYNKLAVYHHKNFQNKGAGASWNLGIRKASSDWIAILGVDDVFLPNRFDKEKELFKNNEIQDGVYGALGVHYYSKDAERNFRKKYGEKHNLTTVNKSVKPKELKYVLLGNHSKISGYFSLDTLTVKKQLLLDVGLFNPKLRLHQDTDLIIKLSCKGNLVSGVIDKPIALRGVHGENRITNNNKINKTRFLLHSELYFWIKDNIKEKRIKYQAYNRYKYFEFLVKKKSKNMFNILLYTINHPSIFFNDQAFSTFIDLSNTHRKIRSYTIKIKRNIVKFLFDKHYKKYKTNFDLNNETISNNT